MSETESSLQEISDKKACPDIPWKSLRIPCGTAGWQLFMETIPTSAGPAAADIRQRLLWSYVKMARMLSAIYFLPTKNPPQSEC
ncbi:hypothetical protein [Paenibacillus riograndensis]|uniref:hypothetical protein n=1 Tax=Paenibacillus riograndensis TaxID=483937 RepID=UPI0012FD3682|nr:hypothetical protein [Paenibacillus riograndensis]